MVSEKLRVSIKLHPERAYKLAQKANLHPSTVSKIINGIEKVRPGDLRVLALAKVLDIPPDECFSEE
jgi:transcriptional regulator with XRE-family HTH domain